MTIEKLIINGVVQSDKDFKNKELIDKYERLIKQLDKEMEETNDKSIWHFLDGKITAYKNVIFDLTF